MKRMTARRWAAVAVAGITLGLTLWLYAGEFPWIGGDRDAMARVTADYLSGGGEFDYRGAVRIVETETEGGQVIATFTDDAKEGFQGAIVFQRGLLGGLRPISASYNTGAALGLAHSYREEDNRCLAVYATDCPPEVASYRLYEGAEPDAPLLAEARCAYPSFLHVYEDQAMFPCLRLYDAQGAELPGKEYLSSTGPSAGVGSAELGMVYVLCGLLLLLGGAVVRCLWLPPRDGEEAA